MPSWTSCTERSTWIEHWPAAVARMSLPQVSVPLTGEQAHALGRHNGIGLPAFDDAGPAAEAATLAALAARIDVALCSLADVAGPASSPDAFVRLGSRSPKDTALFAVTGGRSTCGVDAVALLTAGSMRVAYDLRLCLRRGWQAHVHLRAWQPDWQAREEWRCVLLDGRLAAVCPAWPTCEFDAASVAALRERGVPALLTFAARLAAAWGAMPVVFDVWWRPGCEPVLIELNPWGRHTDAGLFRRQRGDLGDLDDLDGSLRILTAAGEQRWPLRARQPADASAPWAG